MTDHELIVYLTKKVIQLQDELEEIHAGASTTSHSSSWSSKGEPHPQARADTKATTDVCRGAEAVQSPIGMSMGGYKIHSGIVRKPLQFDTLPPDLRDAAEIIRAVAKKDRTANDRLHEDILAVCKKFITGDQYSELVEKGKPLQGNALLGLVKRTVDYDQFANIASELTGVSPGVNEIRPVHAQTEFDFSANQGTLSGQSAQKQH